MSLNCFCFPNYFICILFLQLSNSFLALPQKHEESWKLSLYKRFSIFHFHPSMLLKYTSYHNAIHVLLILCEGRICINPFKNYNEFHIFLKKLGEHWFLSLYYSYCVKGALAFIRLKIITSSIFFF